MEVLRVAKQRLLIKRLSEPEPLVADAELSEVVSRKTAAEGARKQLNCSAIVVETLNALEDVVSNSADAEGSPVSVEAEEAEQDWLNAFSQYAENASSQEKQQLWGRVLARQITKPGSFSLITLRVISELEARNAALFQTIVYHRLFDGRLLKPEPLSGLKMMSWMELENAGLIQGVNNPLNWPIDKPGLISQTENYCLTGNFNQEARFLIPFVKITRAGEEIAAMLPWDEVGALRSFVSAVPLSVSLSIHKVLSRNGSKLNKEWIENITT